MWQPQRRRGSLRLALLVCLIALSHGAAAQGLLDMIGVVDTTPTPAAATTPATTEGQLPTTTTSPSPSPSPVATPSPSPAATPSPSPAATPSPSPAATPSPSPVATPSPSPVATPSPSPVATPSPTPITTPFPSPVATPSPSPVATPSPSPTTAPVPLNAGNVTTGTSPVDAMPGSDATQVIDVGTVGIEQKIIAENALPPGPPADWTTLQKNCKLVFDVEIRGSYIVPFTSPKATVIARVLRDRYLRSATLHDIAVVAMTTFMYISTDAPAAALDSMGGRRRLARSRDLLQIQKSGAELRIVVTTSWVRIESEIATFEEGVDTGRMARDFTLAGIVTENLTMLAPPKQEDLIGPGNTDEKSSGGMESWLIGVIVGGVLLILPIPTFLFVRWHRHKNREACALQAAEAEAARQRMHSKFMRAGSKSFSLRPGGSADIMVQSGSMGGLAGYNNNGRLQSWSGSPERQYGQSYNPYGISRQTSATSMGSALQSARGPSYTRTPSLPGLPRGPHAAPMVPPHGAYEEELQTARSTRSQNDRQ